jgi:phosphoenolpyruvate carboxykinase (GTP)
LDLPSDDLAKLLSVDVQGWRGELPLIEQHLDKFGSRLPEGLKTELKSLAQRLEAEARKR